MLAFFAGALKLAEVRLDSHLVCADRRLCGTRTTCAFDKQRFGQLAEQLLRVTVFLGALAMGLKYGRSHLLVWILGPGLAGAAPLMRQPGDFLMAHVVGVTLLQVLLAAGAIRPAWGLLGMQLVLTTVVCLLLTSRQGVEGAARGMALAAIFAIPGSCYCCVRIWPALLRTPARVGCGCQPAADSDAELRELGASQTSACLRGSDRSGRRNVRLGVGQSATFAI